MDERAASPDGTAEVPVPGHAGATGDGGASASRRPRSAGDPRTGRRRGLRADRTAWVLAAILVPVALVTGTAMALLWPTGDVPRSGVVAYDADYLDARVVETERQVCRGEAEDRLADGTIPDTVSCTLVRARVEEGPEAGRTVDVWAPATVQPAEAPPGTRIVLARYEADELGPEVWAWHDYARAVPLGLLAAAFALVVVVVAGMRGLRAIIGLALAFGVIAVFMLPALLEGRDPLTVGLVGSVVIMYIVLYLAHGFSRRTTTALLGTLAGLGATAVLGTVVARTAHLTGIATEDGYRLAMFTGQLDGDALRGLFLCGVVLAGLGVLNDVTITQASAVWELRAADPTATRRSLFLGGMRIGRDHIASTVYTIAFAYAGAALPILLLLHVYQLPLLQTISGGEFAEEIARTLVGSIGLVLAIPLTTGIAAVVVMHEPVAAVRRQVEGHGHTHGRPVTAPTGAPGSTQGDDA